MTLDEWKAQRQAQMLQPQYNLRKAGEGEDGGRWAEKMKKLDRKVDDEQALKLKDEGKAKELENKKKQVLDIEFHFNDGRRGGLGRRGPGDRGGDRKPNRPRRQPRENGEGGEEGQTREDLPRQPRGEGGNREGGNREGGGPRGGGNDRRPRRPRFQRGPGGDHEGQHAPKVDDIRDFPSLG